MGFVRRGGGGGGGDEDDGDEQLGTAFRRCATCRRELLPWETECPDDGGPAVAPGDLEADPHDALLARLLADEDARDPDDEQDGDATDAHDSAGEAGRVTGTDADGDDPGAPTGGPSWPPGSP